MWCVREIHQHIIYVLSTDMEHFNAHYWNNEREVTRKNMWCNVDGVKDCKKEILKLRFYGQVEAYGAQRKTVILICKFLFQIGILFAPPMLLLVHRSVLLSFFFFNLLIYVFLLIKILRWDNTATNIIFIILFVISFPSCIPSYHPRLSSSWSNVAQL